MPDIYLISDYGTLNRENASFRFTYPDGTVSTFFPHNTEKIFIIGNIEITSQAMKMLMRHNIETVFMGRNGKIDGRIVCQDGKNVFLRRSQYRSIDDDGFSLSISRIITDAKLRNQLNFIQRIGRERVLEADLTDSIEMMKMLIEKNASAESVPSVRGFEGAGARCYFSVFRKNIKPDWAVFKGRKMNPPGDNVNAVMSFIYTLMQYLVESFLSAEGLDTYAGYLHSLEYGRKSLVFDLMEEYRVPLCDTLSCSLFNLGIVKETDFEEITFSEDDDLNPVSGIADSDSENPETVPAVKGVLMTKGGLRKAIEQFEKKLETKYMYIPAGQPLTYRRIVHEQVKHFKRVVLGEEAAYKPFIMK